MGIGQRLAVYVCIAVALFSGWAGFSVLAQTGPQPTVPPIIDGFPASNNVRGGALLARSPGRMVQAGVRNAQQAIRLPTPNYNNITETAPIVEPGKAILVAAIAAGFDALDEAIAFYIDLLFRRNGWPPPSGNDNTDNSNDNTDNSNDNTDNSNDNTDNSNDNTGRDTTGRIGKLSQWGDR